MCPSKLLALFSALPITMVIAGPDGPQDELISQKNNLPTEQPVRSIATFMRNIRRENPCFTTISTLAIAFVMGFLIMRCFIAISSSRKNEGLLVSRRLASRFDNMCSEEEEGRTFLDMAKDRATWRKLLKPAIFLGAGAIIGAAMSAGITAGIMKQEKNQLQLQINQIEQLGILPPLPPAGYEAPTKARLMKQLPKNFNVQKHNFDVTKINERLVNCFVGLTASGKDAKETKTKLTNFARYLIGKTVGDEKDAERATLANELERKYQENIEKILAMNDIKEIEDAKQIFEKAKQEFEKAKQALKKKLPKDGLMTPTKSGAKGIEVTDLNDYVLNYYLTLLGTKGKGPNDDDIVDELESFAASFISNAFRHLKDSEAENIALRLQSQYNKNIKAMVEDKVATAFKTTAFKTVAINKCASYYYANLAKNFVTPTVAKTLEAIQTGTFN